MIVHYFGRKMKTLINVRCVRCLGTKIHIPKVRKFLIKYCIIFRFLRIWWNLWPQGDQQHLNLLDVSSRHFKPTSHCDNSSPSTRLGMFRIGGRTTAIRLVSGVSGFLPPLRWRRRQKQTLTVSALSSSLLAVPLWKNINKWWIVIHQFNPKEFHDAYPDARLLSVEDAVKKRRDENLNWQGCQ